MVEVEHHGQPHFPEGKCPECGTTVGGYGAHPYKHALACFNLPAKRPEDLVAIVGGQQNPERLRRLKVLLDIYAKEVK